MQKFDNFIETNKETQPIKMDNYEYENFPEYFFKINEHMILIEVTDTIYTLVPPNQCDWFYTLTQIDNNTWNVKGLNSCSFFLYFTINDYNKVKRSI